VKNKNLVKNIIKNKNDSTTQKYQKLIKLLKSKEKSRKLNFELKNLENKIKIYFELKNKKIMKYEDVKNDLKIFNDFWEFEFFERVFVGGDEYLRCKLRK